MENAEIGAREDDYDKMFAANIGIADLFELVKDYKQALFYFSRALQAGEKTATPTHIAKARFALGRVYWKLNDSALAIQNYEHFIKLAQMADDVASTSEAAQHLLQALETAVLAENWEMAGEMRYQLGLLYIDARDTDTALGYLTEFHQYCVATNNKLAAALCHRLAKAKPTKPCPRSSRCLTGLPMRWLTWRSTWRLLVAWVC
uniref:Tetratricopeptide repeat protein 29 n=2 Tax=Physcomitrium patens TaxID=3218 RepID=A0A7I4BT09_PHYPA